MEMVEEGRGPKLQESQGLWVQRSKGPEDQDISNSNSKMTLKKVHLVMSLSTLSSLELDTEAALSRPKFYN